MIVTQPGFFDDSSVVKFYNAVLVNEAESVFLKDMITSYGAASWKVWGKQRTGLSASAN